MARFSGQLAQELLLIHIIKGILHRKSTILS
jgi:hypothetical protein